MAIPSALIVLPFLASFLVCAVRYYNDDPVNRVIHPCFLVGASAVLLTIFYVVLLAVTEVTLWVSLLFLALAFASLALGVYLLRHARPRSTPG